MNLTPLLLEVMHSLKLFLRVIHLLGLLLLHIHKLVSGCAVHAPFSVLYLNLLLLFPTPRIFRRYIGPLIMLSLLIARAVGSLVFVVFIR